MKVFIGGSQSVAALHPAVQSQLEEICSAGQELLIGDCPGADAAVQKYLAQRRYGPVTIYASGHAVRNNVGRWPVVAVPVPKGAIGYEFFAQKDIAMALQAKCGFMIWDGRSRGTRENIRRLLENGSPVMIWLSCEERMITLRDLEAFTQMFGEM